MAEQKYTYSIANDTLNGAVDGGKLQSEILQNLTIIIAPSRINTYGDILEVYMKDELPSAQETALDNLVAAHDGVAELTADPVYLTDPDNHLLPHTADHVLRVSTEAPEALQETIISPNWADKCSWYYMSTKNTGVTLTDSGDGLTFTIDSQGNPVCVIDNYHGRYSGENFATTAAGDIPRAKVYDMGLEKTEKDPHTLVGDYTIDYENGSVTFDTTPSGTVTMDYWEASSSEFKIKPTVGKKLKIYYVEVQFSSNILLNDSVIFEAKGLAEEYVPHLVPVPLPSGTMISLKNPAIYKTMLDFINEATGVKGVYPATTAQNPTWRDVSDYDIITYPWQYVSVTELCHHKGDEITMSLEHDIPLSGFATATFYGLVYDDDC